MLRRSIPEARLTRRALMIGAAGLSFAFVERGFGLGGVISPASAASPTTFNPWVTISPDGLISIMSPAAEMGQGSKTSLPLILAEELDADWKDVRIVAAPPNEEIYGNPGFLGMMYTAGSATVAGYYAPLRQFGAQVRRVILDKAGRKRGGCVSHTKTRA